MLPGFYCHAGPGLALMPHALALSIHHAAGCYSLTPCRRLPVISSLSCLLRHSHKIQAFTIWACNFLASSFNVHGLMRPRGLQLRRGLAGIFACCQDVIFLSRVAPEARQSPCAQTPGPKRNVTMMSDRSIFGLQTAQLRQHSAHRWLTPTICMVLCLPRRVSCSRSTPCTALPSKLDGL